MNSVGNSDKLIVLKLHVTNILKTKANFCSIKKTAKRPQHKFDIFFNMNNHATFFDLFNYSNWRRVKG